jgi:hypothetical protein
MCTSVELETYPFPCSSSPVVSDTQLPSRELHAKLIQFEDGKPTNHQDAIVQATFSELFTWSDFMATSNVEKALREEAFKVAVCSAIFRFSLVKIGFVYLRSWGICVAQGQVCQ